MPYIIEYNNIFILFNQICFQKTTERNNFVNSCKD